MTIEAVEQIKDAYRQMSEQALYRPASPSDGFGNITADLEELNLEAEAAKYARQWWKEEDDWYFFVGCCNFATRPATIFAIEAARQMCGGDSGNPYALKLLKMAVQQLEQAIKERSR